MYFEIAKLKIRKKLKNMSRPVPACVGCYLCPRVIDYNLHSGKKKEIERGGRTYGLRPGENENRRKQKKTCFCSRSDPTATKNRERGSARQNDGEPSDEREDAEARPERVGAPKNRDLSNAVSGRPTTSAPTGATGTRADA